MYTLTSDSGVLFQSIIFKVLSSLLNYYDLVPAYACVRACMHVSSHLRRIIILDDSYGEKC